MKLAEALIERADVKQKIAIINDRIYNNAKIQEGTKPNEDIGELLKELDSKLDRYNYLIVHINKTNELTTNKSGETISAMIAKRDVLNEKLKAYSGLVNSGSAVINRISHSEIRILPSFNVANAQKMLDKISEQIRVIDTAIQELNWVTELI